MLKLPRFLKQYFGGVRKTSLSERRVREWEDLYGRPRPKIGAVFAMSSGGSHFLLHKLQGHPNIISLKEGELYTNLKHYLRTGEYPIDQIYTHQLSPVKHDLRSIQWVMLNKPQPAFIAKEYLFNRDNICNIYCFRNPAALFYSKHWAGKEAGQSSPGKHLTTADITVWLEKLLLVSIAGFAQIYDPERDLVVSLECLAAQTDQELEKIFTLFGLPSVTEDQLERLESCTACNGRLVNQTRETGKRKQLAEVLVCSKCGKIHLGPGGYNYIRKVNPEELASWKGKREVNEILAFFERSLGSELMAYYMDERYLRMDGAQQFSKLFEQLLANFSRRS